MSEEGFLPAPADDEAVLLVGDVRDPAKKESLDQGQMFYLTMRHREAP